MIIHLNILKVLISISSPNESQNISVSISSSLCIFSISVMMQNLPKQNRSKTPTKLFNRSGPLRRFSLRDVLWHFVPVPNTMRILLGLSMLVTLWCGIWLTLLLKLSFLLLMAIFVACPSLIYWFIVSTYLILRFGCLVFGYVTVSSFHKRPTGYLLFSFFVVFASVNSMFVAFW